LPHYTAQAGFARDRHMPRLRIPGLLHGLPFALKQTGALEQDTHTLGIALKNRVLAAAVMLHQHIHVAVKETARRLLESLQTLLRFCSTGLDMLGISLDEARH